jgi:hypothetical protein
MSLSLTYSQYKSVQIPEPRCQGPGHSVFDGNDCDAPSRVARRALPSAEVPLDSGATLDLFYQRGLHYGRSFKSGRPPFSGRG